MRSFGATRGTYVEVDAWPSGGGYEVRRGNGPNTKSVVDKFSTPEGAAARFATLCHSANEVTKAIDKRLIGTVTNTWTDPKTGDFMANVTIGGPLSVSDELKRCLLGDADAVVDALRKGQARQAVNGIYAGNYPTWSSPAAAKQAAANEGIKWPDRIATMPQLIRPKTDAEMRAERRALIDEVLKKDAHDYPAFATARKAAVVGVCEAMRNMAPDQAASLLAALRTYEDLRSAFATPSERVAAENATIKKLGHVPYTFGAAVQVYERCRGMK